MVCLRLIILSGALWASLTAANTPPMPPPEPARFAAAQSLVEALPLEDALNNFDDVMIAHEVADNALAWLAMQQPRDRNETVKRVFQLKVQSESRNRLDAAIGETRLELAHFYARSLSEHDLKRAQTFASTPEGKAFLVVQIGGDEKIKRLVVRFLYNHMLADFPRILRSAQESSRILEQINRKH